MTTTQMILTILIIAGVTFALRFGPFLIFPEDQAPPAFIQYLGKLLPTASMGLLLVYAFKDSLMVNRSQLLPELLTTAVILILHWWKRNFLLSILTGTLFYMFLVQQVFI